MTIAEIIAEGRRLDEAATKGPWVSERVSTLDYGNGFVASVPAREGDVLCEYAISADGVTHVPAETGQHDATFIAFARTALPLLVAVAEAAVEMREAEYDDPNSMDAPYPVGPSAVHRCGCPATKVGKRFGPCDCGGDALQARIRASRVAFDAALRGGQKGEGR